mmetsp:Transcript_891/g.2896  ORF Transcript_891/g.2896 Transcript_891/m.2896 type:complete len:333 (-) Transcript_891:142-1140(-)
MVSAVEAGGSAAATPWHGMASAAPARAEARVQREVVLEAICGGLAASTACFFTNPIDAMKTRLQTGAASSLTGSLTAVSGSAAILARPQDLWSLQRGLLPAVGYNFTLNSLRFSVFHVTEPVLGQGLGGLIGGVVAAAVASPFAVLRVRSQADVPPSRSTPLASAQLSTHAMAQVLRVGSASTVQFAAYRTIRGLFSTAAGESGGSPWSLQGTAGLDAAAAAVSSALATVAFNPFDVVATRLYAQTSRSTSGPIACFWSILSNEGTAGLYRGFFANLLRNLPHGMLTFAFYEQLKRSLHCTAFADGPGTGGTGAVVGVRVHTTMPVHLKQLS